MTKTENNLSEIMRKIKYSKMLFLQNEERLNHKENTFKFKKERIDQD